MDSWDDLRFFLAIARYRTVRAAAAALGVNHATVSRRLQRLDETLRTTLLQRTADGYVLTEDGRRMLASAEHIEAEVTRAAAHVEGTGDTVSGTVHVTATDLTHAFMGEALAGLAAKHPNLSIDLSLGARITPVELGRADVALRFSDNPPETLIGRKLGKSPAAVYAARGSGLTENDLDTKGLPWIRWQAPWKQARLETWIDEFYPQAHAAIRVDTYTALESLVRDGVGVGILCPITAETYPDLVRLTPDIDELAMTVWLLLHPDTRHLRRIRLVADTIAEAVGQTLRRAGQG